MTDSIVSINMFNIWFEYIKYWHWKREMLKCQNRNVEHDLCFSTSRLLSHALCLSHTPLLFHAQLYHLHNRLHQSSSDRARRGASWRVLRVSLTSPRASMARKPRITSHPRLATASMSPTPNPPPVKKPLVLLLLTKPLDHHGQAPPAPLSHHILSSSGMKLLPLFKIIIDCIDSEYL